MAYPYSAKVDAAPEDRASILPDDEERSVPSASLSRQGSRLGGSRHGSRGVSFRRDTRGDSVDSLDHAFHLAQSHFARAPDPEGLQDVELGVQRNNVKRNDSPADGFLGTDKTYDLAVINLTYKVQLAHLNSRPRRPWRTFYSRVSDLPAGLRVTV